MNTLNLFLGILFFLSFLATAFFWYKISFILKSKGYETSVGTNPKELFDFIKMIKKEENSDAKRGYKIVLVITIIVTLISHITFIWLGINFLLA